MPKREPPQASPRLLALMKDFQQIAAMAGFVNLGLDPPQLRMLFTLYGRLLVQDEADGLARTPALNTWCERISLALREESSSAVLPPQWQISQPQPLPGGEGWYLVATMTFNSKVTDSSYLRVRTAVLNAYQAAIALRAAGLTA